jgi:hypothetical protein
MRNILHLLVATACVVAASGCAVAVPVVAVRRPPVAGPTLNPAYDNGYSRGVQEGERDWRRGDVFNFADESEYRRGDRGYRREYGDRDWYRRDFRFGFEAGYRVGYGRPGGAGSQRPGTRPPGYSGRGGVGRGGPARAGPAYGIGYSDGYEAGLDDGRDGRQFNPIRPRRYRSGDHGYEREFGSRDAYKMRYREAFKAGYERGYADGLRYGTGR